MPDKFLKFQATVYQGDEFENRPGWWYGQYKIEGADRWTTVVSRKTREGAEKALVKYFNKYVRSGKGVIVTWLEWPS